MTIYTPVLKDPSRWEKFTTDMGEKIPCDDCGRKTAAGWQCMAKRLWICSVCYLARFPHANA